MKREEKQGEEKRRQREEKKKQRIKSRMIKEQKGNMKAIDQIALNDMNYCKKIFMKGSNILI